MDDHAPDELFSLVDTHNDFDAERINIVFAQSGVPDGFDWMDLAQGMLTWDGPVGLDENFVPTEPGEPWADVTLGTFAIEPYRSHRDLLNVWYTDIESPDAVT